MSAAAPAAPRHGARPAADRLATPLLLVHAALILFSTAALVTFLAAPTPETQAWLAREPNATVYRIAWTFSGPAVVVVGFLAAMLHAAARLGWPRTLIMFTVASLVALGSELLGTSTGYPFGGYAYTPLLGYRVLGLVPFPIPLSWTFILYCALAMCGRLLPVRDDARTRLLWSAVAAVILTAWDVAMDPAMVKTFHWVWHEPGQFYGMPYTNWLGWLATGFVVAWLMLRVVPPSGFAERVSPSPFPLWLYAVNGVMPVAICARHGLVWAAAFGTLAMAVPVLLAARAGAPRGAAGRADRGAVPAASEVALTGD